MVDKQTAMDWVKHAMLSYMARYLQYLSDKQTLAIPGKLWETALRRAHTPPDIVEVCCNRVEVGWYTDGFGPNRRPPRDIDWIYFYPDGVVVWDDTNIVYEQSKA